MGNIDHLRSSMIHTWSNQITNKDIESDEEENKEEENPIFLMKRTKDKIDKLQEELDNARRDFLKFSSLYSSECKQDVGVKMDYDGEEEKMPEISGNLRCDGDGKEGKVLQYSGSKLSSSNDNTSVFPSKYIYNKEEKMLQHSESLRHEGSR